MKFADSPVLAPTFPPWRARLVLSTLAVAFATLIGRAGYLQGWKNDFLQGEARPDVPERLPLRATEMPQPRLKLVGKAVRPSAAEVAANPRARSAVLRVAEKPR